MAAIKDGKPVVISKHKRVHEDLMFELTQMRGFLNLLQSSFKLQKESLDKEVEKQAQGLNQENVEDLLVNYSDKYREVESQFPRFVLSNFVIAWYSFVESNLFHLCELSEIRIVISIYDKVPSDKGVTKARRFIESKGNNVIDKSIWSELALINEIRNMLVHEGNRVWLHFEAPRKESPPIKHAGKTYYLNITKELMSYILAWKILDEDEVALAPNFNYCNHLVDLGIKLFSDLYSNLGLTDEHRVEEVK